MQSEAKSDPKQILSFEVVGIVRINPLTAHGDFDLKRNFLKILIIIGTLSHWYLF